MFKKLKDKLAEEVKQSPLKSVQQLAQAVVSPSSSSVFEPTSSNDKFCIEEGDIEEDEVKTQGEVKTGGFTSVALTGQITSPLRDKKMGFRSSSSSFTTEADNLFPAFDSQPTNFHVQSDWESASEVEDRYSQLEHINKESLYEAYRKVYNRYNRMKNKYQELVTHYRLLEKEKDKAKSVLAETQDKTLMRIGELKEQCLLEQQAKAHLEEALRNELEERDHIINTLKTKVQYLKAVNEGTMSEHLDVKHLQKEEADNLIDFTENACVSKVPLPSDASNNKETIPWVEEQLERCKKFLMEKISKLEQLEKEIEEMKKEKPYEESSSFVISGDIFSDQQRSKEELNVYLSLTCLINELEEEAKSMRGNKICNSSMKCVNLNLQSTLREDIDEDTNLSETEHDLISGQGDGTNIPLKCKFVHNVANDCDELKELKIQNELLKQKLEKEVVSTENLKTELHSANELLCTVRTQLKMCKENYEKENLNFVAITQTDNDVLGNLTFCINSLYSTRKELVGLENSKERFEDELKNQLNTLKADQAIQTEQLDSDKSIYEEEISLNKLTVQNNELREELKSLKNEYNSLVDNEGSLSTSINNLTLKNHELDNKIKSLTDLLEISEKECYMKEESLQHATLDFSEETCRLKNQISSLEEEHANTKKDLLILLESQEKQFQELTVLKKENNDISVFCNVLEPENDQLKSELEEKKKDSIMLSEINENLLSEMLTLRKEHNDLTNENESMCEQFFVLEKCIEKANNDLLIAVEEKEKLLHDVSLLRKENDAINSEKLVLNDKFIGLRKDFETIKQDLALTLEAKETLVCDASLVKIECDNVIAEKTILNNKLDDLKKDLEETNKKLAFALEAKEKLLLDLSLSKEECDKITVERNILNEKLNILKNESEQSKMELELSTKKVTQLSDEIVSFRKNHNKLNEEKKSLHNTIGHMEKVLESNKTEYLSTSEEINKLLKEIELLKKEQEDLSVNKHVLLNKIESLEDELNGTKHKISLLLETKDELCNTIQNLKQECEAKTIETNSVKEKIDNLSSSYEKSKEETIQLLEVKLNLTDELDILRKKHNDTVEILNVTKKHLEDQQKICTDLDKKLNALSETLKIKCNDVEEKCLENVRLKTDMENLVQKINQTSSIVESIAKDKQFLLNSLLLKLDTMKNIRDLQKTITMSVQQFRAEINKELNDVKYKIQNELMYHVDNVLENENCSKKISESENKSKQDIDSYNKKIKYLQTELQSIVDMSKSQLFDKDSSLDFEDQVSQHEKSNNGTMDHCNGSEANCNSELWEEKLSELKRNILFYQKRCNSLEEELNKATLIMQSFTNIFKGNHEYKHLMPNAMFDGGSSELDETVTNKIQGEIVAMELFLKSYDFKRSSYHNNTEHTADCKNDVSRFKEEDTLQNIDSSNFMDKECKKLEVRQLKQEIKIRDDMIKKLQQVVLGREEESESPLLENSKNNLTCSKETMHIETNNERINERQHLLELENKSLLEKLQNLREKYDSNTKNLIAKYEQKIEEKDEEIKIYEFEHLGAEKRHIVNEMKEQIENLQQDLDERGDAFERLYVDHQQSVKSKDDEIQQLRINYEKEMREQDKKWRSCLDRRLAEEEARHQQETSQLTREWANQRTELETTSRLAVKAVESGSSSSDIMRRQVQALTLQLNEFQSNRCEACDHQRAVASERLRSITSKYSQDCTEMEYLRNILYEYMMGKEPMVLARVLCALVKFDENQMRDIVLKEKQKVTVFGQLGIL